MNYVQSSIKKAHYHAQGFKNKPLFLAHIAKMRADRINNSLDETRRPARRYAQIVKSSAVELQEILFNVVDYPSFYKVIVRAGTPHIRHAGWEYGEKYSRSSLYSRQIHKFIITAPRVLTIEQRQIEGVYNIYCKKIKKLKNITVYDAKWLQKHRGFDVSIKTGWIAADEKTALSYHSEKSAKNAVEQLHKKLKRQAKPQLTKESRINISIFKKITGACQTGCAAFCSKMGLDIKKRYPIREIINLLNENENSYYANLLIKSIE